MPQHIKVRRGRKLVQAGDRPNSTRLYVPGFLDNEDQFFVDQQQLGIDPVTAITVGTGLVSIKGSKDPERYKRNQLAYSAALAGNQEALRFLGQRGVILPQAYISPAPWHPEGGQVGGWATRETQEDAAKKYQEARQRLQPAPPPPPAVTQPPPPPPPGVTQPPPQIQPPADTQQPGFPPITIQLPEYQPPPQYLPAPGVTLPGGEPTIPPPAGEEPKKAGLLEGDVGKMALIGVGALILSQVFGKGGRRRR